MISGTAKGVQPMGYLFLALFALTLFVMYIAIRRAWAPTLTIGGVGAILSVLFVILYALTNEKTSTEQAIFAGIVAGLGFAGTVVVIATFFRANQPSTDITLVTQSPQEDRQHERRDHRDSPQE
jgi:hypothetical protein